MKTLMAKPCDAFAIAGPRHPKEEKEVSKYYKEIS
jgi:hypothetical protein